MPIFEGKYFSIVFLGQQNPSILNHDFLMNNGVLPLGERPFKDLLGEAHDQPFSGFVSTPVLATLTYGTIRIVVQQQRYEITHREFGDPPRSPIIDITKRYFGELLRYTPLKVGGMNLNGIVQFADAAEELAFDQRLGIDHSAAAQLMGPGDTRVSVTIHALSDDGAVQLEIAKPKDRSEPARLNFNFEFPFADMKSFIVNLDRAPEMYHKFRETLASLSVESTS